MRSRNYRLYAREYGVAIERVARIAEDESLQDDSTGTHDEWLESCSYGEFKSWMVTALADDSRHTDR